MTSENNSDDTVAYVAFDLARVRFSRHSSHEKSNALCDHSACYTGSYTGHDTSLSQHKTSQLAKSSNNDDRSKSHNFGTYKGGSSGDRENRLRNGQGGVHGSRYSNGYTMTWPSGPNNNRGQSGVSRGFRGGYGGSNSGGHGYGSHSYYGGSKGTVCSLSGFLRLPGSDRPSGAPRDVRGIINSHKVPRGYGDGFGLLPGLNKVNLRYNCDNKSHHNMNKLSDDSGKTFRGKHKLQRANDYGWGVVPIPQEMNGRAGAWAKDVDDDRECTGQQSHRGHACHPHSNDDQKPPRGYGDGFSVMPAGK